MLGTLALVLVAVLSCPLARHDAHKMVGDSSCLPQSLGPLAKSNMRPC